MATTSFGLALAQILILILLAGAVFGLVWWHPVRRGGWTMLAFGWILSAILLAALGTINATLLLHRIGSPAARQLRPMDFFALYVVFLAIVLLPPALALGRRARKRPDSSLAIVGFSSAGWSLIGVLLALVSALALDFANVPFVPGMRSYSPSVPAQSLQAPRPPWHTGRWRGGPGAGYPSFAIPL